MVKYIFAQQSQQTISEKNPKHQFSAFSDMFFLTQTFFSLFYNLYFI